jgi:molybdopterin/thiamine biosynthesis adenylyltransferase
MKYKQQVQNRAEAISNLLETLERGLQANAISKQEAVNLIAKLKTIISEIDNFADLED